MVARPIPAYLSRGLAWFKDSIAPSIQSHMHAANQTNPIRKRSHWHIRVGWFTLGVASFFCLCQCQSSLHHGRPYTSEQLWPDRVPSGRIDFVRDVQPLLEDQCLECHNHVNASEFAGLNLETRESALSTGRSAPVIVPGNPAESLLIRVLKLPSHHPVSMPAAPEKVAGVRLAILEKWIVEGAEWPADARLSQR